jgi:hypothetical protein
MYAKPEGNFIQHFLMHLHFTMTHLMGSGVEFSTCSIMSVLKKFLILEPFGLQIFRLGILNGYSFP